MARRHQTSLPARAASHELARKLFDAGERVLGDETKVPTLMDYRVGTYVRGGTITLYLYGPDTGYRHKYSTYLRPAHRVPDRFRRAWERLFDQAWKAARALQVARGRSLVLDPMFDRLRAALGPDEAHRRLEAALAETSHPIDYAQMDDLAFGHWYRWLRDQLDLVDNGVTTG